MAADEASLRQAALESPLDPSPIVALGAIFGNVGTIVAFQVGHEDAGDIARQFGGAVDPEDLTSLPNFHAYVRMLSADGAPEALAATPSEE